MKKNILVILFIMSCFGMSACSGKAETYEPVFSENNFSTEEAGEKLPVPTEYLMEEEEDDSSVLKINVKDFLSIDEITFLGEKETATLRTEQVKELIKQQGMNVTTNEEFTLKSDNLQIYGKYPDEKGTEVIAFLWPEKSEYVKKWEYCYLSSGGGDSFDLGIRDIAMLDTLAEVLDKIGCKNAEKAEKKFYEIIGNEYFPEYETSKYYEVKKIIDFSEENGLFNLYINAAVPNFYNEDMFELIVYYYFTGETVFDMQTASLAFRFVRNDETENKYKVIQIECLPKH